MRKGEVRGSRGWRDRLSMVSLLYLISALPSCLDEEQADGQNSLLRSILLRTIVSSPALAVTGPA